MAISPFILGLERSLLDSAICDTVLVYERVGHNTGNLAFHYAIDNHLGGNLPTVPWSASPERIDSGGDIAVLPCANQIGAHLNYGELAKKFQRVTKPIVAIGLGAQGDLNGQIPEVPQGSLDWVRSIVEHAPSSAPNIGVRGPFTLEVLDHYGLADKATVIGCPTLFINPDPFLGKKIYERITHPKKIAVASGHQRWGHLSKIESSLAKMVSATSGSYIGQSPLEMVKLTRGEANKLDVVALKACRDYAAPEMDLDEFVSWANKYGNVFFDVPSWMEHYRRFDLVIGARIHGVMLALQAGVPGVCIAHDSRTLELCKTMMVPYVLSRDVSSGIKRDSLIDMMKFDPDAFDNNRYQLAVNYNNFLKNNSLLTSRQLLALCKC